MLILQAIWSKIGPYLIAVGAAFAAVGAIYLKGRGDGKEAVENKQLQSTITSMEKRHEVEDTVRSRPDGSASDELHKSWSRD